MIIEDLSDDDGIMRHTKSLYARGNVLISRFRKCTHQVKIKLFRSFLSSAYGSSLWTRYKQCTYKHFIVAYNSCIIYLHYKHHLLVTMFTQISLSILGIFQGCFHSGLPILRILLIECQISIPLLLH